MNHIYDMIIIGGGPGGYTAALYGARAGLDTLILEKLSAGGQMAITHQIDNYPGFEDGIDGFLLGQKMQQGAERFGARTEYAEVTGVDLKGDVKAVESSEGTFYAKTVVLATGAGPREPGRPRRAGPGGPGRSLLRRLRRDVLPGQNCRDRWRREYRRSRRPDSFTDCQEGNRRSSPGYPAGNEDLP